MVEDFIKKTGWAASLHLLQQGGSPIADTTHRSPHAGTQQGVSRQEIPGKNGGQQPEQHL